MKDTLSASPDTLFRFLTTVYGEETAVSIFRMHNLPVPDLHLTEDDSLAA